MAGVFIFFMKPGQQVDVGDNNNSPYSDILMIHYCPRKYGRKKGRAQPTAHVMSNHVTVCGEMFLTRGPGRCALRVEGGTLFALF